MIVVILINIIFSQNIYQNFLFMKSIFKNKSLEKLATNGQDQKLQKSKLLQFFQIYRSFPKTQVLKVYPILFQLQNNLQQYQYYKQKGLHYSIAGSSNLTQTKINIYSSLGHYCELFSEIKQMINIVQALLNGNDGIQQNQECVIFETTILIVKYIFYGWFEDYPVPSYRLISYISRQLDSYGAKTKSKLNSKFGNGTQKIIEKALAGIMQNIFTLFTGEQLLKILLQVLISKERRYLQFLILQIFIEHQNSIIENGKSIEILFKKCKYKKDVVQLLNKTRKLVSKFSKQNIVQKIIEKELFNKLPLQQCLDQQIRFPYAIKCLSRSKQENFEIQQKNKQAEPQIQQNYRKINELLKLSKLEIQNLNKKTRHLNQLKIKQDNEIKIKHNQRIRKQQIQIERIQNMLQILKQEKEKPEFIKIGSEKLPSLQTDLKNLQDEMVFLVTLQKPPLVPILPKDKTTPRVIPERQQSKFLQQQLLQLSNIKGKIQKERTQIMMKEKNNNIQQLIRAEMLMKEQKKQKILEKMEEQRCKQFKQIINESQSKKQVSSRFSNENSHDVDMEISRLQNQIKRKKQKMQFYV